jgi:CheY-like chemotaxis protein
MHSSPPDVRSLRILVVEDDDDHAELILHVLNEHHRGHRVDRVADGAAALAYLDERRGAGARPDLVLLDLKLPKVGGIGVLEYIKRDSALQTIPVVVLTTSATDSDRERAYVAHANSYVVKPAGFRAFEALLRDIGGYWGQWNQGI